MTLEEMGEIFNNSPYISHLDRPRKRHNDPLISALILMEMLVGLSKEESCITCAEHDKIWFVFNPEEIAKIATKEEIEEIAQCGIGFDSSLPSFYFNS